jgi:glycosyltransferase involved in cell wall biosynthesis
MRCLHFTNSLDIGGTAKTLQIFCQELAQRNHTVQVWCRELGPRAALLEEAGVPVQQDNPSLEGFVAAGQKQDIIHVHVSGRSDPALANALRQIRSHNPRLRIIATNVFGGYDVLLDQLIDTQLFVSRTLLLKFLLQHPEHAANPKYAVLYNPIDTRQLLALQASKSEVNQFRHALGIPSDGIVLGRVGRPDLLKWDPVLERVIKQLTSEPKAHFAFMAAPPSVAKRLRANRVGQRCHFLPQTSSEREVVHFYQTIDILLHSSAIGETFGCTLAEAMLLKRPVIVRSTPFTKRALFRDNAQIELVDHHKTGYCGQSSRSLAMAARELIRNTNQRTHFGEEGSKKVRQLYDSKQLTDTLIAIYQGAPGLLTTTPERQAYALEYEQRVKAASDSHTAQQITDQLFTLQRKVQSRLRRPN